MHYHKSNALKLSIITDKTWKFHNLLVKNSDYPSNSNFWLISVAEFQFAD